MNLSFSFAARDKEEEKETNKQLQAIKKLKICLLNKLNRMENAEMLKKGRISSKLFNNYQMPKTNATTIVLRISYP
jgi:hypothetical protein